MKEKHKPILLGLILLICVGLAIAVNGQKTDVCDKECVKVVANLVEQQKNSLYISWSEKDNRMLGDRVADGIVKVFPRKDLFLLSNVKLYLPIIRESFMDIDMIELAENKKPTNSIYFLEDLKKHVSNPETLSDIDKLLRTIARDISSHEC